VVRNDGPKPLSATVSWEAGDENDERDVTVGETGIWRDEVAIPVDADAVTLQLSAAGGTVENSYDLS
jgi:hypothetical protein